MLKIFDKKFIKFIFFGGINTLFAYAILAFFLFLDFHYTLATLISAIVSIASGFFINKHLVFNVKNSKSLIFYYVFWFLMYLLNIFIQFVMLELLLIQNLYFNSFIATAITSVVAFIINKRVIFKQKEINDN